MTFDSRKSHGIKGKEFRAKFAVRQNSLIDDLAEKLEGEFDASGWTGPTLAQAADELGISYVYANALLQRMRKRLGPWAV